MKELILEKILTYFKDQKYNLGLINDKNVEIIYNLTEDLIDEKEKKEYELWLEYFLKINFSKTRCTLIENLIDNRYFDEKIELIQKDKYNDLVFSVLITSTKLNVFENNLEFDETRFIMKSDPLAKQLNKIIRNEIQRL